MHVGSLGARGVDYVIKSSKRIGNNNLNGLQFSCAQFLFVSNGIPLCPISWPPELIHLDLRY